MKQHIIIDQLNELSDKGKERLRQWWKPLEVEPIIFKFSTGWEETNNYPDGEYGHLVDPYNPKDKENALPLLSIGQMIEFLDNDNLLYIRNVSGWHGGGYEVSLGTPIIELKLSVMEDSVHTYRKKGLCDALWEACVEVLEK